jgi:effector-binding domain-containing protein
MIEPPKVVRTGAQPMAFIPLTVPRSEIQSVMGPGFQELGEVLRAQGLPPTGPPFTHHLRIDPEVFDFELAFPVAGPVAPSGRVRPGEWPAMAVARTIYHGPYEGLVDAWREFHAWIAAEGLTPAEDVWERYLVGPESSPDPADWRTELNRPLVA